MRTNAPHTSSWRHVGAALATLGALLAIPQSAKAASNEPTARGKARLPDSLEHGGSGDGVYGRFDGTLAFALGAGLEFAPTSGVARPAALGSLRFYQSVGLSVAFAQSVTEADPLERSLAACFLLEPLFLVRWSSDHQWGRPFWDLTLDSLSLSLGAIFAEPRAGSFGDQTGFRLGLGAGLPLLARADGPWLRLGGRLDTGLDQNAVGAIFANVEWQWFFGSPRPE